MTRDALTPHLADLSPFRTFGIEEWAALRADMRLTLTSAEVESLTSFNDRISLEEVERVYLPISRLLWFYVSASQQLFSLTARFLGHDGGKVPYIIGLAGSVAAGKSTTARVLQALLARWPSTPQVELVTTDGFLFPNAVLRERGLMERKGFPESYDTRRLLTFLSDVKAGRGQVRAPVYSHLVYDVVDGDGVVVNQPDILIVEGLNVLQTPAEPRLGAALPFVSDFFDFAIYLHADEGLLQDWYVERFLNMRETAFADPKSYFHKFSTLSGSEALKIAHGLWGGINLPNLRENIAPTMPRADLILTKGPDHSIIHVALRKI